MKSNHIGRTDSCAVCYMKAGGPAGRYSASPGSDKSRPLCLLGVWVRLKRNRGSRRARRVGPLLLYARRAIRPRQQIATFQSGPGGVRPSRERRPGATEGPFGAARPTDDRLKRDFPATGLGGPSPCHCRHSRYLRTFLCWSQDFCVSADSHRLRTWFGYDDGFESFVTRGDVRQRPHYRCPES